MYPLSEYDGQMKTKDWSKSPHFPVPKERWPSGEHKWVKPDDLLRRAAGRDEGGAAVAG